MKKCICLHAEYEHEQLPGGEFVGACYLCPCAGFKVIGGGEARPERFELADRAGLERQLAKRLRKRFEVLFDEETLGLVASTLIQSAWALGWQECADYNEKISRRVLQLDNAADLLFASEEKKKGEDPR
jgi:hypothetical protein